MNFVIDINILLNIIFEIEENFPDIVPQTQNVKIFFYKKTNHTCDLLDPPFSI
jgi:hypothetical protein